MRPLILLTIFAWSLHPALAQGGERSNAPAEGAAASKTDELWKQSDEAFHAGDYPLAVRLHRSIVALDPHDTESFGVGAWLLWSMGKKDEALKFIDQGLKANPRSAEMWNEAGQHNDMQHRYAEAAAAYGHAVQFSPPGENTQMLRRRFAHATEKSGNMQAGAEIWRGLVRDYPAEQVNKNNLARVDKKINDERVARLKAGTVRTAKYVALVAVAGGLLISIFGRGRRSGVRSFAGAR